jgi:hypothetical protein
MVPYRHVKGKPYGGTKSGVVFRPAKKKAPGERKSLGSPGGLERRSDETLRNRHAFCLDI